MLHTTRAWVTQSRVRWFQCGASRSLMKINALELRQQAKERNFALLVWACLQGRPSPTSHTDATRQLSHRDTSRSWHRLLTVTWQLFHTLYHCVVPSCTTHTALLFQFRQRFAIASAQFYFLFVLSSWGQDLHLADVFSNFPPVPIWPRVIILLPFSFLLNAVLSSCASLFVYLALASSTVSDLAMLKIAGGKNTSRGRM